MFNLTIITGNMFPEYHRMIYIDAGRKACSHQSISNIGCIPWKSKEADGLKKKNPFYDVVAFPLSCPARPWYGSVYYLTWLRTSHVNPIAKEYPLTSLLLYTERGVDIINPSLKQDKFLPTFLSLLKQIQYSFLWRDGSSKNPFFWYSTSITRSGII